MSLIFYKTSDGHISDPVERRVNQQRELQVLMSVFKRTLKFELFLMLFNIRKTKNIENLRNLR